jgi:hypothetical protein
VDHALAGLQATKPMPTGLASDLPHLHLKASISSTDDTSASDPSLQGTDDATDGSDAGSEIGVMPATAKPQPRTSKPTKASFLDEAVHRLAAAFFPSHAKPAPHQVANLPAFHALAAQTARVKRLSHSETALLVAANNQITRNIDRIDSLMHSVGIKPSRMEDEVDSKGIGGPFVPISAMHIDGIADPAFVKAFAETSAHVKELDTLFTAFRHVPLTTPVHGPRYELTSDFGPRIDPFTHHLGFHPGLDFGGPWGSTIYATAPGKVIWAGRRGGYGNMVEIDHGFGIQTVYGHMSSILVKVGAKVKKGTPIGKLGSTGRSTGPHVHYEVRVGDVVRDPSKFIEAGRHVLQ